MTLTFAVIFILMAVLIPPLKKNTFFILHGSVIILVSYWIETHYFKCTPFIGKTLLLCLAVHFISINIFTFLAYMKDKKAAVNGEWRIPERDLHLLEILGGWTGAFIGQKILHHKNRKRSYQAMFWLVPIVQIAFIIIVLQYLGLLHI